MCYDLGWYLGVTAKVEIGRRTRVWKKQRGLLSRHPSTMSLSLAAGEMGYTVSKGVPTLVKGPYEGPGFPLTKLVADAYDYMEGEDPSGSIKSEIGPVTKCDG